MHDVVITHIENPGPLKLAARWRSSFIAASAIGILALAGGLMAAPAHTWNSYLIAYFMFVCFAVGGLFFTALNFAVNASWVAVTRRVSSGLSAFLPAAVVLYIGIMLGAKYIFPWASGDAQFHDPSKTTWLSLPFVAARDLAILLIWTFFAWKLNSLTLKQDKNADLMLTRKAINWSIAFMPVFAFSFTLFSYDLMMSLEPHWWSTMFGVYCFAGLFQSVLALMLLIFLWMKRNNGPLAATATPSHVKDLGTLVFAFTIFMTYIGFSQYMLIYYANLPEETFYYIKRQDGGWGVLFLLLLVFKFIIPFFGLLSQAMKKTEKWLYLVCASILFGQFLDLYWMVMPARNSGFTATVWIEVGVWLGFAGVFGFLVSRFYSRHSMLPMNDPYLIKSVNWRFWE